MRKVSGIIAAAALVASVALVGPATKKATRIGARLETKTIDGVKKTVRVRVAKKSGKDI
mgnify:CR=1 FL=1